MLDEDGETTQLRNPSDIIISLYSFQSLADVNKVFSKVLGKEFFSELELTEVNTKSNPLDI